MGLMNSALQIGRSAILSYQAALQTVGSNISSAGSPDYTRLSPQLDPISGSLAVADPSAGGGVALTDVQRYLDEALEGRLRLAIGAVERIGARQSALAEIETQFNDAEGLGLGARLTEFWNHLEEVQNTAEDVAIRDLAVSSGVQLAQALRDARRRLVQLGTDLDGRIKAIVEQADDLSRQIAELNQQITTAEAGRRGQATGLRDQRDGLLRELSKLFEVTVREQTNGAMNVYVGSEALVQDGFSRGLSVVSRSDGEFARTHVRFSDTSQELVVRGGQLGGLIAARDEDAYGRVDEIDQLAAALISEVNAVHSNGQGLIGFAEATGTVSALDADVSLASKSAGLSGEVKSGAFYITVMDDSTRTPVAHRIEVSVGEAADTTLATLVEAINAEVPEVTAAVTADNRLSLTALEGFTFSFGWDGEAVRPDTSGVLAALGVNTFFSGTNATDIEVSAAIQADSRFLAAATSFVSGDGSNAAKLADLRETASQRLSGVSIDAFYGRIANRVAVDAAAANADVEARGAVLSSLQGQKEAISGVNLDEEALMLLKFQRAFQGATRFMSAVEESLAELMSLVR